MKSKINLEWLYAAGIRALRTVSQTALGMFSVGMAMDEVNWKYIFSVALVSGVYSLLTSFATTLPELGADGVLEIDTTNHETSVFRFTLNNEPETLIDKKLVKFSVDSHANLSQNKHTL